MSSLALLTKLADLDDDEATEGFIAFDVAVSFFFYRQISFASLSI